jgi:hypothetical protein
VRRSVERPRRNSRDGDPSTEEFGRSICAVVNMGDLKAIHNTHRDDLRGNDTSLCLTMKKQLA